MDEDSNFIDGEPNDFKKKQAELFSMIDHFNTDDKLELLQKLLKSMSNDSTFILPKVTRKYLHSSVEQKQKVMQITKQCLITLFDVEVESIDRITTYEEDSLLVTFTSKRMSNLLTQLPREVFQKILNYLPIPARWNLVCTCKDLRNLIRSIPNSFRLWKSPTDNYLATISTWHRLIHLRIENGQNITSSGIGYLSTLTNLQTLHLKDCTSVTDEGLSKCLREITNLSQLVIDLCSTTDFWMDTLSHLQNLETLILRDSETLTDHKAPNFRFLTKLRHFEINGYHNLSTNGLNQFTTNLRVLRVGYSRRKNFKFTYPLLLELHVLGANQVFLEGTWNLRKLSLAQCELTGKSTRWWTQLTCLQELSFVQCPFLNFHSMNFCNSLTTLRILEVKHCKCLQKDRWFYQGLIETLPNLKCLIQEGFSKIEEITKDTNTPIT